jgi:hypothetical protein
MGLLSHNLVPPLWLLPLWNVPTADFTEAGDVFLVRSGVPALFGLYCPARIRADVSHSTSFDASD